MARRVGNGDNRQDLISTDGKKVIVHVMSRESNVGAGIRNPKSLVKSCKKTNLGKVQRNKGIGDRMLLYRGPKIGTEKPRHWPPSCCRSRQRLKFDQRVDDDVYHLIAQFPEAIRLTSYKWRWR